MNVFTFSFDAIGRFLAGGVFLFLAVRAYRSKEKQSHFFEEFIAPLILGIAWLATGILLSVGVLTEGWARAVVNVSMCALVLVAMPWIWAGQYPGPPGTRTATLVVYVILAVLLIALSYVSIRDAYRFSLLSESGLVTLNVPKNKG